MNKIRTLKKGDVPNLMELSRHASWNQTPADWERIIALAPDSSWGIEHQGGIVASTTAIAYGRDLAWIGMVLTHPDHRGKGMASSLMRHAIAWCEAHPVNWIKLDATDQGQPIYEKLGFLAEAPIQRWKRPAGALTPRECPNVHAYVADPSFDRAYFGAARIGLLGALSRHGAAFVPGFGYAMARPGDLAAYFGPCISRTPEAARCLLEWFLSSNSAGSCFWDLFPGNAPAVRLALAYGFDPVRKLMRMARPAKPGAPPLLRNESSIYAIAGFEYG